MFGIENIIIFIGSGILLNLYPGPDTFYIIGRSISQGRGAGVSAALGIGSGGIVHTLLGAFGLSAVIATSAHAFTVLKFAGCGYLVYQGVSILLRTSNSSKKDAMKMDPASTMRIYRQGALTNILNPKVAVFFLAFLPQFISVSSDHKSLAFITLGMIFVTTGTLWCLIVAFFSSSFSGRMRKSPTVSRRLAQLNGLLFIFIGLKLATARLQS